MEISAETGSDAYLQLLSALLTQGNRQTARGMETIELRGVALNISNPQEVHVLNTARRPSAAIAATEALHLIAGTSSLTQLDSASNGKFTQFADNGRLRGAYGPRAYRRLREIVVLLTGDPGTRQAVASVWRGDESQALHDVPCTLSYQFLIRDEKLELHTSMRSNDAWLGLPYDLEVASVLQRTMAGALGVPAGAYRHNIGSAHLYDHDVPRAGQALLAKISHPNRAAAHAVQVPSERPFTGIPVSRWVDRLKEAESLVLREPGAKITANHWYDKHVPYLPSVRYWRQVCEKCRYVTDGNCPECTQPG